ncbi:hypothetical protein [Metabacillus sp. 84]|uniref:hypothetical protein n=1 Tax=Metabacillus sp. 84 TaxID=3404705 RepID=UPI003CE8D14C
MQREKYFKPLIFDGVYEELITLLGCKDMSPQRTAHHLDQLELVFDEASGIAKTRFFFSSDITRAAKPIAIEGSRNLIDSGYHREAMFWITANFARCQKILEADARPEVQNRYEAAFRSAAADLGISSQTDIKERSSMILQFLPKLMEAAERIMDASPYI